MTEQARATRPEAESASSSPWAQAIEKRYRDAYSVAQSFVDQGDFVKIAGIIVAMLLVFGSLLLTEGRSKLMLPGFVVAGLTGAAIYSHGVRICAEGQQLLATLDVAVNTSQFLDNEERAKVMKLKIKQT